MEKKFQHEKIEECGICKKTINTGRDKWVAITDFDGVMQGITKFYHRQCLNDLLKGKMNIMMGKIKENVSKFLGNLFGNLPKSDIFGTQLKDMKYEMPA